MILLILIVSYLGLKIQSGKTTEIRSSEQEGHSDVMIEYNSKELFALKDRTKHDKRLKILNPVTVKKIRRLRLNRRGCRGKKKGCENEQINGIWRENLIEIQKTQSNKLIQK